VSQPYDRGAHIPQPGELDPTLNEFWVTNPFEIAPLGHNLSAFERKRTFLNLHGRDFLDISFLTGTDGDADGRAVAVGDFFNNGRQDIVMRQAGGGSLLFFENHFPQRHYLEVSLRGTKSNRLGIGARLVARVQGQQLVREMYPQNTFASQMPNIVHFGLGSAAQVDQLTIQWPSGQKQVLDNLAADRHIVVEEGNPKVQTVAAGQKY
jgi:enediyne biosynthesis protein E4